MTEQQPPEWEEPEIIDVDALPEAMGECHTGKTQGPRRTCFWGSGVSNPNQCSNGSGVGTCTGGFTKN